MRSLYNESTAHTISTLPRFSNPNSPSNRVLKIRGRRSAHNFPLATLKPITSIESIGDGVPINVWLNYGWEETVVLDPFVDDFSEKFELVRWEAG